MWPPKRPSFLPLPIFVVVSGAISLISPSDLSLAKVANPSNPVEDEAASTAPVDKNVTQGALRIEQEDGSLVECPLKHTDVQADISGFIARVNVTQVFQNPTKEKIEAVYVFPLPSEAAVDNMTMQIGERKIVGLIKRRDTARRIYEQALAHGQTAALLEQERPNIFTQSVGNIAPGEEVKIQISYVDVLKYDMGTYEFHYPMVVGPRFIPGSPISSPQQTPPELEGKVAPREADTDRVPDATRISPPVLKPGFRNGHDISLSLNLDAGVPIQDLSVANHESEMKTEGNRQASVVLSPDDSIPNKDFVVRYKVMGEKPEMAILSHTGAYTDTSALGEGYFMLMVQPKEDEKLKQIPPREMVFLVDVSGSMSGETTAKVRDAMQEMLSLCGEKNTVQVITFAGQAHKLFEKPVPVNDINIAKAVGFTKGLRGAGGTHMLKGVKMAIDEPLDKDRLRIVVMLTDGFIGNEAEIIKHVGENCGDQIRFWAIGIGSSPNMFLVDGVARQGGGMGKRLALKDDTVALTQEVMHRIQRAQLAKIKIDWGNLRVAETYPAKIPELWSGRPVILFGRYQGKGSAEINISGVVEAAPTFRITEYVGEDWLQERVSFPVELPVSLKPGKLAVRDGKGNVGPAQFVVSKPGSRKGRVHFVVDLPADTKGAWTLIAAPADLKSDLFLKTGKNSVELGTSKIAVRCPFGKVNWRKGRKASKTPAPITAIRLSDGTWGCAARLHSPHEVLRITGKVLVNGPVFARIQIVYTFKVDKKAKTYTIEIEAIVGQEVLVISERSELGHETRYHYRYQVPDAPNWNTLLSLYNDKFYKQSNYWTLSFGPGLAADRVTWMPKHQLWSTKPNRSKEKPHSGGYGLLVGGRSDGDEPEPGDPRYTYAPPKSSHLMTLNPSHGEWVLNVSNWGGCFSSKNENFVGVLALRCGDWRKPHHNVIVLQTDAQARPRAVLPINTGARVWALYGSPRDPAIAFPSEKDWPNPRAYMEKPPKGEHWPQVQYARPPQLAAIKYGYLPLDMVKDWTLAWDDPSELTFPHIFAKAEMLAATRKNIANTPLLNNLVSKLKKRWDDYIKTDDPNYPYYPNHHKGFRTYLRGLDNIYMATGDEVYARALAPLLIDRLRRYVHQIKSHDGIMPEHMEPYLVREADLALGSASLTDEQRRRIRALLIFCVEAFKSPHYAPPGLGYNHHGNNDLEAIKHATFGSVGALLPSHPKARQWAKTSIAAIEKTLVNREYLPGSGEDLWYAFYNLEIAIYGAMQLQRAGFADYFSDPRLRQGLAFYGKLLTVPDPRHGGAGSVVPFGNGQGSHNRSVAWAIVAAELADKDPEIAGQLMWYWRRAGSPGALRVHGDRHDFGWSSLGWIDVSVPSRNPGLESEYVDGWGALFRSGYGTKHETFMALQLGRPVWETYNAEGGFHLYAKGKPLCMIYGIRAYDVGQHRGMTNLVRQRWMANRPSFDYRSEKGGTTKVLPWASTSGADLAGGQWTFRNLFAMPNPNPKEGPGRLILSKPRPEASGVEIGKDKHKTVKPIIWRRHVLFVKDDDPKGPNYFVIRDTARSPVVWDWSIWCLAKEIQIDPKTKAGHFPGKYGVDLDIVPLSAVPELVTGSYGPTESVYGDWHQKVYQVQLPAGAGQFAAVLYPRLPHEPKPTITAWAGGAGGKVVLPGETHHVLLTDKPTHITRDGLTIIGRSAVVRVKHDVTRLDLLAGERVGTKDVVLNVSGDAAVSVTVDAKKKTLVGESRGPACRVALQLPASLAVKTLVIDGKKAPLTLAGGKARFTLPKGQHAFGLE